MNAPRNATYHVYRLLVILTGLIALIVSTVGAPVIPGQVGVMVIIALAVALQMIFPFRIFGMTFTLVHMIALSSSLWYGPTPAGWAIAVGITGGKFLSILLRRRLQTTLLKIEWLDEGYLFGRNILPLVVVFFAYRIPSGLQFLYLDQQVWLEALAPSLSFTLFHAAIVVCDLWIQPGGKLLAARRELLGFGLLELLPLPFILLAIEAFAIVRIGPLAILGAIPTLFAVLLSRVQSAYNDLKRRLLDLSTLNEISQTLRSTLDMEEVFTIIHRQVTQLLGVDNFYVALYNPETQLLWYPLAVKHGQHQTWPPRPLADRLTDRVIREGKPLLLAHHAREELARSGLPPSEDAPYAWIGVPLVTPERTIGCLALFSISPQVAFTPADLDLLTTLSGQASIAVENALLYTQAERRAAQLETLNKITGLITASLDPREVLEQVCRSVTQVVGGQRSAIFLLDQNQGQIALAYAFGLSEAFIQGMAPISSDQTDRAQCCTTGVPFLTSDVAQSGLAKSEKESLIQEGIQAFGDFPLITSESRLGYLSVYFDSPHFFESEEVDLLQTFASQAALAVSNARLYARTDLALSQRVNQLAMLETVGRELAAAIQSERLFDLILDYALEMTRSIWGNIRLYDPQTDTLFVKAFRGYATIPSPCSIHEGIVGRVWQTRQAVNAADVLSDPDYKGFTAGATRSQLSIPLIEERRVLGVLTVESAHVSGFSDNDQSFLGQLAVQAAVAVRNAELYHETRQRLSEQTTVLDSVGEGIALIEPGGRIRSANLSIQAVTGLQMEALVGQRLTELPDSSLKILGFAHPEEAAGLVAGLEQGRFVALPTTTFPILESGSEKILERSTAPVWGEGNRAIGCLLVWRDVTEAYQINQARELLTETLVHDLRSPISAVLGALNVMEETTPFHDQGELFPQAMRIAQRSAQRISNMVDSLLEIARLQSDPLDLEFSPMQLRSLVGQVLVDFYPQSNELGILLRNDVPENLPDVRADVGKMSRVMVNLIDNALKHTPSGGQITISASLIADGYIQIEVSDNGPGIPEDYREKIFERFSQVPGQRGRRRGSGLGLTFCRLVVEAHHGRIWVEPRVEAGSVFCFTLPIQGQSQSDEG